MAYLIAHTDLGGNNAAQATVSSKTESKARETFATLFPHRVLTVVAKREGRAPTRKDRKG